MEPSQSKDDFDSLIHAFTVMTDNELDGKMKEAGALIVSAVCDEKAAVKVVDKTSQHFGILVKDSESNNSQLGRIAAATEEISETNDEINRQIGDIHSLSIGTLGLLKEASISTKDLSSITEQMLERTSRIKTGKGKIEDVINWALQLGNVYQNKLIELHAKGVNVMDRDYKPVPNTNPPKYTVSYNALFDRELQPLFDAQRESLKGSAYSLLVDVNGYLSTHHSSNQKPLTGNYDIDLINSREKIKYWNNDTEIRRAQNTMPFLLQTYMRNTGEIMNDLAIPLYINGIHWGNFITGMKPEILLEN